MVNLCAALLLSCKPTREATVEAGPKEPTVVKVEDVPDKPKKPVVPPEIVRLRELRVSGDIKTLTVGDATGEYHLSCNRKAAGCVSPTPGKNYLLFKEGTHYRLAGAKSYIDLAFIQGWTVTYEKGENVGLVAEDDTDRAGVGLGLYALESWNGRAH